MGKMGATPVTMIAFGTDEIDALRAEIAALRSEIAAVRMAPIDEWVTVQEYAKIVGRHERTVRNWINAGRIESKRVGTALMVRR